MAHLHRAGELLRNNQLQEADSEVALALDLRSDDVRARNLLGLVRFRAGRHEEALQLYRELVGAEPDDTSLRLNLGLVELRMGRHDEAAADLERVVEKEPTNLRAHGYFGLALMRSGDFVRAREAFVKAGQDELVRQVDERMAVEPDAAERAVSEVRRAADKGLRAVTDEAQPFAPAEADEGTHAPGDPGEDGWQVRAPGEPAPPPVAEPHQTHAHERALPLRLDSPLPIAEFATARLLRPGKAGEPFAIAEGGMLVLRVDGRLPTRTFGAIASTGQLAFEPMTRRARGRATDESFGVGIESMFLTTGKGLIVVAPRGARFTALALSEDVLYLREAALFSFEETLHWESGRIPGGAPGSSAVIQLRGTGRCVMRTARVTFCAKIEPGETLFVGEEALLGWIGRVIPRQLKGSDGEPTPYIECTGEGVLILEEPAPI